MTLSDEDREDDRWRAFEGDDMSYGPDYISTGELGQYEREPRERFNRGTKRMLFIASALLAGVCVWIVLWS